MRRLSVRCAGLIPLLIFALAAVAQDAPKPAAPPKLIPSLDVQNVSLEAVFDLLHDADPAFQAVIIRDPDVPADYPLVRSLRLKKVSIPQVMRVLQNTYQFEVTTLEEDGPPLQMVRVVNPERMGNGPLPPGAPAVHAFRLTEAVVALNDAAGKDKVADPAANKAAVNKVLTAVNALLTLQAGGGGGAAVQPPPPVVQVHEDTLTLLVKGSAEQVAAVRALLETMEPLPEFARVSAMKKQLAELKDQRNEQLGRVEGQKEGLAAQYQAALAQVQEREKELLQTRAELERLKLRLQLGGGGGGGGDAGRAEKKE